MIKKTIQLEGIEIKAPIGYYKTERVNKNEFLIDLSVAQEFSEKLPSDNISNTFNYETLLVIVRKEMKKECKLLEDVAFRILKGVCNVDESVLCIQIVIRKKNPPLKGKVKFARVELQWSK